MKYMKYALRPMIFMIFPLAVMLIHLDSWFGYRPLRVDETSIIAVKLSEEGMRDILNMQIEVDDGLMVETPPLRIFEEKEIDWRIRAKEPGEHTVLIRLRDHVFKKRVVVSDKKLLRVSRRTVSNSIWKVFTNPGEKPLVDNRFIHEIEIHYPSRSIEIFGWNMHWIVIFFVLSIIAGFSLKRYLKVEV
jgi:hypothetical protein